MSDPVIKTVGVPKEIKTAEHRVAMTPDGVRELERRGIDVFVETGAGQGASIEDSDYVAAGAPWTGSDAQLATKGAGLVHLILGSAEYQLV